MSSQLKWKFVFIAAVILLCIFGIFGLPHLPHVARASEAEPGRPHPARPRSQGRQPPGPAGAGRGSHWPALRPGHRSAQQADARQKTSPSAKFAAWTTPTFWCATSIPPLPALSATSSTTNSPTGRMSPAAGENNGYLLTMKPSVIADFANTRWTSRSKSSLAASTRSD